MSALYHAGDFNSLTAINFQSVLSWIKSNPGKSVDACATALSIPYEVVYAICIQSRIVILPSASGEITFTHTHK